MAWPVPRLPPMTTTFFPVRFSIDTRGLQTGRSFAFRYQFKQTSFDVVIPAFGASSITLSTGNQPEMSKIELGFVVEGRQLEANCRVCPFVFLFYERKLAGRDKPRHFLIGNKLH